MNKTVLLGITSGIAAYKSLELVKELQKENIIVNVIITNKALQMLPKQEVENVVNGKIYCELFDKNFEYKKVLETRKVEHIDVADFADIFIIAPATANTVAKLAHGIADDYLTTTALAMTGPIIVCPSMNVNMWNNPTVQNNIKILKQRGMIIIEPTAGMLACGYEGKGRLADVEAMKEEVLRQLNYVKSLTRKKVLVTAGGTTEKIDEVRYISNKSSGKMGVALAEECYMRGADVLLLRSKQAVSPRYLIKEELFETAEDLQKLIEQYVNGFDYIFHAAAVSDFKVKDPFLGKIQSGERLTIALDPQIKILDEIKKLNPKIYLAAFKAEYQENEQELINAAKKRLQESNADAIIANDISKKDRGFEVDTNEVIIVLTNGKTQKISLKSKNEVAKEIIEFLTVRHSGK